jgi:tetratricopeptide (TPR) repeat protein
VRAPVALIDVVPTLARLLGLAPPEGLAGRSLLDDARPSRRIYAETYYPRIRLGWSELRSLVGERHQLIEGPRPELYDVVADARQLHDLAPKEPETLESMRAELGRYPRGVDAPQAVDPEVREKLAALGYLTGGPATESAGPLPDPRDRIHEIEAVEEAFRLTKGRDEEAVVAFRRLLAGNPRQLDVQLGLAQALARLERYAESAAAYESAIRAAPAMAGEIALVLARVQLLRGRFADVEANARLGLETSPARARELLAWAALGRGDLDAAEREARQAQGEASAEIGSALALAEVHVRRSRFAEALAVLDRARARSPSAPVRGLELARGDALARLGRHAEAEAAFEREIDSFPRNTEAYARLAVVYALEGRTKAEVGRLLEEMHAAVPRRETALLAARTLASLGDAQRAALWRQRAGPPRP